jgi:fructose-bisphosphate aldolase class I
MILPGLLANNQSNVKEIATATVKCFLNNVPAAVGGIAFLSGGQRGDLASARLNEMNKLFANDIPWPITFSFSRVLQFPALEIWRDKKKIPSPRSKHYCFVPDATAQPATATTRRLWKRMSKGERSLFKG